MAPKMQGASAQQLCDQIRLRCELLRMETSSMAPAGSSVAPSTGLVFQKPGQTSGCLIRLSELQGPARQVFNCIAMAYARGIKEGGCMAWRSTLLASGPCTPLASRAPPPAPH